MLNGLPLLSSLDLTDALAPLDVLIPPLFVNLPSLTLLSIEDAEISNLGMTSCIRTPLIETIKLTHAGLADAEAVRHTVAAIYPNLPNLLSRFVLHDYSRHTSQNDAHVRPRTRATEEEEQELDDPFFGLKVHAVGGPETWEVRPGFMGATSKSSRTQSILWKIPPMLEVVKSGRRDLVRLNYSVVD